MKKKVILLLLCMTFLGAGCGKDAAVDESAKDQSARQEVVSEQSEPVEVQNAESDADEAADSGNISSVTEDPDNGNTEASETSEVENTDDQSTDVSGDPSAAADNEESTGDVGDMSQRDLFADFIMGKGAGKVADDFYSEIVMTDLDLKSGDQYTVTELEEVLGKTEMFSEVQPSVSYAPLSCHGGLIYVMKLGYKFDYDEFDEYFFYSDNSGELELKFAIDGWTRRGIFINDAGIVYDSGSNGAGSHTSVVYAPDKSFSYKMVSKTDEQYYGYSFYDDNDQPMEALNATIEEAGEGNQAAMDVAYYREKINGKVFYYYLGGAGKITQDTVDYIDGIAQKHGFTFDGKAAADEARAAYEKELDIESAVKVDKEAYWKTL